MEVTGNETDQPKESVETEERGFTPSELNELMAKEIIVGPFLFAEYAAKIINDVMTAFPEHTAIDLWDYAGRYGPLTVEANYFKQGTDEWKDHEQRLAEYQLGIEKLKQKRRIAKGTFMFLLRSGILDMRDDNDFLTAHNQPIAHNVTLTPKAFAVLFQDKGLHPDEIMKGLARPEGVTDAPKTSLAAKITDSVKAKAAAGAVTVAVVAEILGAMCKGEISMPIPNMFG